MLVHGQNPLCDQGRKIQVDKGGVYMRKYKPCLSTAFLTTYLRHAGLWDEFRRLGCHFVACKGKTNMSHPLVISQGLGMCPFLVFDGDFDKATENANDEHRRDNACLRNLLGSDIDSIPDDNVIKKNFVLWRTRIMDEIRHQVGDDIWDVAEESARNHFKLQMGVRRKNSMLIAATVESLLEDGQNIDVLEAASSQLIAHCKSVVDAK